MAATATALRVAPAAARDVAIDIRGVSHAFELDVSRLPVLESVDLSVEAGEFVSLLGPSGCGKSTLLRLISGLEQPTSGSISAEGLLIDRPDPSRILSFRIRRSSRGRPSGTMSRPAQTRRKRATSFWVALSAGSSRFTVFTEPPRVILMRRCGE